LQSIDEDDPGAGYALFTNEGAINNTSPHGALRAYDFAGYTLQVRACCWHGVPAV
jgi:hypothetical protein